MTASLSSSVLHYRTIHGRTFHSNRGQAEYWHVHLTSFGTISRATPICAATNHVKQGLQRRRAERCLGSRVRTPLPAIRVLLMILTSSSHYCHTIIIGDKLFLPPLKDDIQVRAGGMDLPAITTYSSLTISAESIRCRYRNRVLGNVRIASSSRPTFANWPCSDFADEYPNCEVVGTDLSPIQPTWIPPNLKL